jgi:uncharacterized protein (TIRG00374 family)
MDIDTNKEYSKRPRPLVTILKLVVTLFLFYWVVAQIEVSPLLYNLKNADITYLIGAIFIHAIAFVLFSLRWWYLYRIQDPHRPYKTTIGSYYLGLFCNNFLPTGIGGDIVRIIRLRNVGFNTHILVSSTMLDRIIGLSSILLMGLVAIVFTPNLNLSSNTKLLLILLAISIALGLRLLFSDYVSRFAQFLHKKFDRIKIAQLTYTVISTLLEYRKQRTQILLTFFISFVAQYLLIFCYILIGISLDIELPISVYFTIVPIVFVATALPISIGGLGIRESTLIALFVFFQVDKQTAIALSLFYFAIILLLTLPGAFVILSKHHRFRERLSRQANLSNHT